MQAQTSTNEIYSSEVQTKSGTHHHHSAATVSRCWAKASACCFRICLSCTILCQKVYPSSSRVVRLSTVSSVFLYIFSFWEYILKQIPSPTAWSKFVYTYHSRGKNDPLSLLVKDKANENPPSCIILFCSRKLLLYYNGAAEYIGIEPPDHSGITSSI